MKIFNGEVLPDNRVYYQSIYTTMKNAFDDLLFFHSHRYLEKTRGDNDGFVSEYSAKWGDNITKIEGRISHAEILDYNMRKLSGIHIPGIYKEIANGLSKRGF